MRIQTHPATESGADTSRTAAKSGNASATAPDKPTKEEINASVAKINKAMQALVGSLEFSIDQDARIDVIKVVDMKTKEVIRQFPPEEILSLAKAIDRFSGDLHKETA